MRTFKFTLVTIGAMAGFLLLAWLASGRPAQAQDEAGRIVIDGGARVSGVHTVNVAPPAQSGVGPTATPDAEGVIYAIVQEGDSFWSIAARHGLTLDEIYELNDASEGDFVQVGQKLIVGYADEATPEAEATETESGTDATTEAEEATPTPPLPTATPTAAPRGGEICLSAFVDENRNGQQDAGEPLKPSVAFTISSGEAVISNYVSDGVAEPYCITGLESGSYRVTRSTSDGEVLTTSGEWSLSLTGGTSQTLAFGSYMDEEAAAATVASPDNNSDSLNNAEEEAAAPVDDGEGGITRVIVIAAVVVAVLLLVGVLVIVLSGRRSTI